MVEQPSEMVERMARAIHDECEGVTGPNDDSGGGTYVRAAIAALKAMREPTSDMVEAAVEAAVATRYPTRHPKGAGLRVAIIADWKAQIDAALGPDK